MNSNSIYSILSSKPNNSHFLKRYLNYILARVRINKPNLNNVYLEKHHICPKSDDLFPEYFNFSEFPWNLVNLTAHQHIFAHCILWKAYGGKQTHAFDCMIGNFNSETNKYSLENREVPKRIKLQYAAKAREEAAKLRANYIRGKSNYKNSKGERFFLSVDDPRIQSENLTGHLKGRKNTQDQTDRDMSRKFHSRKATLYFLDAKIRIEWTSPKLEEYLAQGWVVERTKVDQDYVDDAYKEKISSFF